MSYERLVFSTVTLAKTREEEETIVRGIEMLSSKNIPSLIIVDGGSSSDFIARLGAIPRTSLVQKGGGLFVQTKEALNKASGESSPYIFYAESNKEQFFKTSLDEFVQKAFEHMERDPNCGIVLPSRTSGSFATFPSFQREEELSLNRLLKELMGRAGDEDFAYGPRIILRDLIPYLNRASKEIGWGWMSYLLIIVNRLGKSIYTIPLELPCPEKERGETRADKLYRLEQFRNHIDGINEALIVSL